MKAIVIKVPGPIAADAALVDINLPRPSLQDTISWLR